MEEVNGHKSRDEVVPIQLSILNVRCKSHREKPE